MNESVRKWNKLIFASPLLNFSLLNKPHCKFLVYKLFDVTAFDVYSIWANLS